MTSRLHILSFLFLCGISRLLNVESVSSEFVIKCGENRDQGAGGIRRTTTSKPQYCVMSVIDHMKIPDYVRMINRRFKDRTELIRAAEEGQGVRAPKKILEPPVKQHPDQQTERTDNARIKLSVEVEEGTSPGSSIEIETLPPTPGGRMPEEMPTLMPTEMFIEENDTGSHVSIDEDNEQREGTSISNENATAATPEESVDEINPESTEEIENPTQVPTTTTVEPDFYSEEDDTENQTENTEELSDTNEEEDDDEEESQLQVPITIASNSNETTSEPIFSEAEGKVNLPLMDPVPASEENRTTAEIEVSWNNSNETETFASSSSTESPSSSEKPMELGNSSSPPQVFVVSPAGEWRRNNNYYLNYNHSRRRLGQLESSTSSILNSPKAQAMMATLRSSLANFMQELAKAARDSSMVIARGVSAVTAALRISRHNN